VLGYTSRATSSRRLAPVVVLVLSVAMLTTGPLSGTALATKVNHCGHVLVGPGGDAIGIANIRAVGVGCIRARSVFRAYIRLKLHPPKGWRVIKGPNASTIVLGSGRARIEGNPYNG